VDLQINLAEGQDLSGQIYRQIRAAILDGRLRPGEAVPATRELARRIGVARGTVGAAYERLSGEGLLESRIGAGTFVSQSPPGPPDLDDRFDGVLRPHPRWPPPREWPRYPDGDPEFDFRAGVPDPRWFPFGAWRRVMMRELTRTALRGGAYGDVVGLPALRAAIHRHIGVSRAVDTHPDRIIVTSGAQQALDLIARVLLGPGDRVAVEEPGYSPPQELFRSMGVEVVPVPVDGEGIVTDAIPDDVRLAYVSPTHQYPLGVTMSLHRRRALLAWADKNNAAIVEDDYDSEFRFGGRPLEALQSLDTSGRVLYVGTFSKTLMPALRLGFVVAPPSLTAALGTAKFVSDWHSNLPAQAALARFIDEGSFARHVRRMRNKYQARHERIRETLDRSADAWLRPLPSQAGMHLTALLPAGTPTDTLALARKAWVAGVALDPLSLTYCGPPTLAGFILGYGAIPRSRIAEGLARLRDGLA
jgi:GntR family transcriptional regulator / MocR family aminotransferase